MTAVLPVGYVTILEAAEMLQPAMYAGVPDLPIVIKLRQEGIEVNDGPAINRAVAELWKAVDKGALRSMAIGGRPSSSCKSRCAMHERRSRPAQPPGRGFTLLRQSNPAYPSWPHGLDRYFTERLWRFGVTDVLNALIAAIAHALTAVRPVRVPELPRKTRPSPLTMKVP